MPWRPDWTQISLIELPLPSIELATPTVFTTGELQLVDFNRPMLMVNSATAEAFSATLPEPSSMVLAVIAAAASLPLVHRRRSMAR